MLTGGNCYWDVECFPIVKWCGWSKTRGGEPLAEVEGHETRHEAMAALQAASQKAWAEVGFAPERK